MSDPFSFIKDKPLREVTTFGLGGPASLFIAIDTVEKMQQLLRYCHQEKIRTLVLGKGSNTLFEDRGFKGLVIHNKIDFCEHSTPGCYQVGAGYSFSLLGSQTARHGFAGLEFASGIPGSVGGAIWMNAGANGEETCNSLASVDFITAEGELKTFQRDQLQFAYRHSPFQKMAGAIVSGTFKLKPAEAARQKQLEIISYRKKTQPLSEKSAGCIFRNPPNGHAGALIEQCALKGTGIGGAQVSAIHANFIINTGAGTAEEVRKLIEQVQRQVLEKTGIALEAEVRAIPYDQELI